MENNTILLMQGFVQGIGFTIAVYFTIKNIKIHLKELKKNKVFKKKENK